MPESILSPISGYIRIDCSSITDGHHIEWPRMESDESSFTNFSMFSFFDLSFSGRLNFCWLGTFLWNKSFVIDNTFLQVIRSDSEQLVRKVSKFKPTAQKFYYSSRVTYAQKIIGK